MTAPQLAWLRSQRHEAFETWRNPIDTSDYSRGLSWARLCAFDDLFRAFGIELVEGVRSPAEAGWAREAKRTGLA